MAVRRQEGGGVCGRKDLRPGAHAGRRSTLDQAPAFAAVLGLELPHAEGTAMTDLLAPSQQGIPAAV